jgi:hypothetical protein
MTYQNAKILNSKTLKFSNSQMLAMTDEIATLPSVARNDNVNSI